MFWPDIISLAYEKYQRDMGHMTDMADGKCSKDGKYPRDMSHMTDGKCSKDGKYLRDMGQMADVKYSRNMGHRWQM